MEEKHPLISIITPVYNVEKYLEQCIISIQAQTYKNIEIILIDDGSTDNSSVMCDEYAEQDTRIRVCHKVNGGLSSARNKGIEIAVGEYLLFVDSDDYIHPNIIEKMLSVMQQEDVDIVGCQFLEVEEGCNKIIEVETSKAEILSKKQVIEKFCKESDVTIIVSWCKLYKKELFDTLRFQEGKLHEDEFIIHHIIDKIAYMAYLDDKMYYYRQRNTSIMGEQYSLKRLDGLEALEERILFYKEKKDMNYIYVVERYLRLSISHYNQMKQSYPKHKKRKKLHKKFCHTFWKYRKELTISKKMKLYYMFYCIHPSIYACIERLAARKGKNQEV